ncbi:MAG: T9SS type A sorting domain-containing protein [Balneolaceae bacterium]|nr:T9SS type A sorting domain-containing protein [Balneolaceae bacterium]
MPDTYDFTFFKSMLLMSVLLFLWDLNLSAQQITIPKKSHALSSNYHIDLSSSSMEVSGTLNIVAVRVEFQPDENRLTSGDGTFAPGSLPYLQDNEIQIDPLPHNRSYFEAHLEFAKNYFERVSSDQLSLNYQVLPDVYQLDQKMEYYSPTGQNFTSEKLALLSRDVWQKVKESGGFNTSGLSPQNTAFIIFHAGVGRDIELVGTSLDITPQDIPSIYLGTRTLGNLLGDQNFNGFPINNGTFRITNSLILPRTLSRRGMDVSDTEFVLQLSTNGLITATIGSHLGLPDLFNPETGDSGIGRFGLMDGAAIFSYNGLFPPEPSAWEKSYLGWASPFKIDHSDTQPISLAAASLRLPNNSVARHELSSSEYFLVENRHRDPENNGATITIQRPDGSITKQNFTNYDETFTNQESGFEELLEPGVITNVDNFDWSLPGGLDHGADGEPNTPDDRLLNGGILIWHIDEAIIRQEIETGGVNANPNRRGVDLEEADGAQDIGQLIPGQNSNFVNGTAFDFWWQGNTASVITTESDTLQLYENRFGPDTHPENSSNSGATTFFEFYDFSGNSPVATFRARQMGNDFVQPVALPQEKLPEQNSFTPPDDDYWSSYPLSLSIYTAREDSFLVIPTNQTTYALQLNDPLASYRNFQSGSPQLPYLGQQLVVGSKPGNNNITLHAWNWNGDAWQQIWSSTGTANQGFLSSDNDNTLFLDLTDDRFRLQDGSQLSDLSSAQQRSETVASRYSFITPNSLQIEGSSISTPIPSGSLRLYTGILQLTSDQSLFYLIEDNAFYLIDPELQNPKQLLFESPNFGWPAMVDFDGDDRLDFLFVNKDQNRLDAVNNNGAFLNHFPIVPPKNARFTGTPLVTDLNGDQSLELIAMVQDSASINLYAYDQKGKQISEFPLYVGGISNTENDPIHPVIAGNTLYAASHAGDLKAWSFPQLQNTRWKSQYGNEPFNKVTGRLAGSEPPIVVSEVLVNSETYNWPNPAQDETYLRYQTSAPGKVDIKIITVSGRVIYDDQFDTNGGAPEEHRISTADWGSGIYLARVKATVNGRTSSKLIKIAVVH